MEGHIYDMTEEEKEAYRQYHQLYEDLDSGKRKPTSLAQSHFIDCCYGRAVAETIHEKAYLKDKLFRLQINKSHQKGDDIDRSIPEYEEGQARPGLCDTDDIKRARGDYFGTIQSIHNS